LATFTAPIKQHEERASPEKEERVLDLAHHLLVEAHHARVEAGVEEDGLHLWKALEVGGVQGVDLRLRLLRRRAGLEARDHLPGVAVVPGLLRRGEGQRSPQHHGRLQEEEIPGHHAHHRVGLAPEAQVLAHDLRVGALALPEGVAEHDFLLGPHLPFLLGESPAEEGPRAQEAEERGRGSGGEQLLHGPPFAHRHALVELVEGLFLEDRQLAEAVVIVPRARDRAHDPCLGVAVVEKEDPVRLGHGQGPEQHGVHDREDRGVGPDAEGQGEKGGQGEPLVLPEEPSPIAKIAKEGFHGEAVLSPAGCSG